MKVNQIVAVGSVDGILTTGALLYLAKQEKEIGVQFCQAFTVDKVDISSWAPNSNVAFVDLAVNNRDPKMTENFVRRILDAGHTIVAIIDEHSASDWATCLVDCGLSVDSLMIKLMIKPMTQGIDQGVFGIVTSSGDVLATHLDKFSNELFLDLETMLSDARAADQGRFIGFGAIVNQAIKSAIQDDSRRVHLARCAASGTLNSDPLVHKWVQEYEEIESNHKEILSGLKIDRGIVFADATGKRVDMTSMMMSLYKIAPIAAVKGEMFDTVAKSKSVLVSFGVPQSSGRDIFAEVKAAGVVAHGGFAQKVNVLPEDFERVVEILGT